MKNDWVLRTILACGFTRLETVLIIGKARQFGPIRSGTYQVYTEDKTKDVWLLTGIDPDNFTVTLTKLTDDHKQIVLCAQSQEPLISSGS